MVTLLFRPSTPPMAGETGRASVENFRRLLLKLPPGETAYAEPLFARGCMLELPASLNKEHIAAVETAGLPAYLAALVALTVPVCNSNTCGGSDSSTEQLVEFKTPISSA